MTGFLQSMLPKREQDENHSAFYDLALEVLSFMQYSVDYTGQPDLVWEEIAQSITTREEGIIGGHLRG